MPCGATARTAGRAVFFSGLTVLLGLLGLVLFGFMILRSVGHRRRGRGGARRRRGDDAPARRSLAIVGVHLERLRVRRVQPRAAETGAWSRLAWWVMRRPVAVLVPTLAVLLPARHAVPARDRSTRPTPASCPRTRRPEPRSTCSPPSSGRVRSRRSCWRSGRTGAATSPANLAALYDYSRRLAADPRIDRVDSLVDVDPRLTLDAVRAAVPARPGPPDRFVAEVLARDDEGRPDGVHASSRPTARTRPSRASLVGDLRSDAAPLAPPAGDRPCSSAAARRTSRTW